MWLLVNYGAGERECGNTAALHCNEDKQWSILIPQLQVTKLPQRSISIRTGGSQDKEQRKPLLLFLFCYVLMLLLWTIRAITGSWVPGSLLFIRSILDIHYSFGFYEDTKCIVQFSHCIIKLQFCFSHSMELLFTSLNFATVDSTLICRHDSFITGNFFQIVFIMFLLAQTIYIYNCVFQQ